MGPFIGRSTVWLDNIARTTYVSIVFSIEEVRAVSQKESAWKQGQKDALQGKQPANVQNAPYALKQSYNSGYAAGKKK